SLRFLEEPFRRRRWLVSRSDLFLATAGISLVIAGAGSVAWALDGWPERFTGRVAEQLALHDGDRPWTSVQADGELLRSHGEQWIGSSDAAAVPWGLLWGDSHAMAIIPAFADALRERGMNAAVVAHTATAPVLGWYNSDPVHGLNERSEELALEVFRLLERKQLRNVLLVACWSYYDCDEMRQALLRTVGQCRDAGINVWIMTQVPFQPLSVPRVLWYVAMTGDDERAYSAKTTEWNGISGNGDEFLSELQRAGVQVLDIRPKFLDSSGGCYVMQHEGRSLYADSNHLTPFGAEKLVLPFLRTELFQSPTTVLPNGLTAPGRGQPAGHSGLSKGSQ
ncbi:MAG: SGNH hydrolase domain-containing protein, partial [Planctomycetaceae bacterium]